MWWSCRTQLGKVIKYTYSKDLHQLHFSPWSMSVWLTHYNSRMFDFSNFGGGREIFIDTVQIYCFHACLEEGCIAVHLEAYWMCIDFAFRRVWSGVQGTLAVASGCCNWSGCCENPERYTLWPPFLLAHPYPYLPFLQVSLLQIMLIIWFRRFSKCTLSITLMWWH